MGWVERVNVDGFIFKFINVDGNKGVLVESDLFQETKEYYLALRRANGLFHHISDLAKLKEDHDLWYKPVNYRQHVNEMRTLEIAVRFSMQKELPIPEWIPQFIEDLKHGTPLFAPEKKSAPRKRPGYVYVIRQVGGPNYKIGLSTKVNERIYNFGIKLPFKIEPICIIKTDDMFKLERELHDRFDSKRVSGEWFKLTRKDISDLKKMEGVA